MLKIGSAQTDITPPVGTDLSGFALRKNPSTDIYDPLKMRWLAMSDGSGNRVLLGAADVLSFSRETYKNIQKEIRAKTNDQGIHIALATSHTHSGPATVPLLHCGKMNRSYLLWLKKQIVDSAVRAFNAPPSSVSLRIGSTDCPHNINRRQEETGPLDSSVQVIQFISGDKAQKTVATLLNYACHPVVLGHENNSISADYPGYACDIIEKETDAPCLFLNGASGDVNPRDAHHAESKFARKMGEAVAQCGIAALQGVSSVDCIEMEWREKLVHLPVNVPKSIEDVERRIDMLQERFGLARKLFENRIERDKNLLNKGTYPQKIAIRLSLLTLTPGISILFVPGELFSSIGLRAKKLAAPRKLIISGFSNGSVGYLSDRQAYADGGYEPYFANFFYDFPEFQPDLEDYLLRGIDQLLNP